MTKRYSTEPEDVESTCKARGSQLRTHFKKMHEVGAFIRGMKLEAAIVYLEQVLDFERAIPFKHFRAGCGRHAQAKIIKAPGDQVGWPIKSVKYMLDILRNLAANADSKALDKENLFIRHVQVNNAKKMRRRTYRAHGRINPYMCNPCHVEVWAQVKKEGVEKAEPKAYRQSRKELAKTRLVRVGGGVN
uniref:60S ribosomal protein L17 n=2 Tax=Mucochytrium quahogii TaxID=96639 RepID=A0A7S2W7C5_9STRA|mmetsp:Transcript_20409/g.33679  ORF Transcript_20409/g.33679 Transcript_20409/m.33679 type:complete len:189 (+) Transcript_20409:66-632(+)|eukprot:CAMPEP_0203769720 /NCGR_PEP_ID=MMETSP0099_2-20121227/2365_1 /ASSEMBLY_ACC=CAM_ASM_000209 /TAXON_ID=96639 /ORGANISM=" , Strain NY0313808BC1" /LENGTH=188 /DNA_ID=CAMNT_0050666683 /DNA_START=47 /DNA_END=613 /DNA_ORIENTATION=+